MPKLGYVATVPGSVLKFTVDTSSTTQTGAAEPHTVVTLSHMKSYEGMGQAGARADSNASRAVAWQQRVSVTKHMQERWQWCTPQSCVKAFASLRSAAFGWSPRQCTPLSFLIICQHGGCDPGGLGHVQMTLHVQNRYVLILTLCQART